MATTVHTLRRWFDDGVAKGATHMIVACDTFDWGDFPVYVRPDQKVREVAAEYDGKNMHKIMEVYDLRLDRELQMREVRAFHY